MAKRSSTSPPANRLAAAVSETPQRLKAGAPDNVVLASSTGIPAYLYEVDTHLPTREDAA